MTEYRWYQSYSTNVMLLVSTQQPLSETKEHLKCMSYIHKVDLYKLLRKFHGHHRNLYDSLYWRVQGMKNTTVKWWSLKKNAIQLTHRKVFSKGCKNERGHQLFTNFIIMSNKCLIQMLMHQTLLYDLICSYTTPFHTMPISSVCVGHLPIYYECAR